MQTDGDYIGDLFRQIAVIDDGRFLREWMLSAVFGLHLDVGVATIPDQFLPRDEERPCTQARMDLDSPIDSRQRTVQALAVAIEVGVGVAPQNNVIAGWFTPGAATVSVCRDWSTEFESRELLD